MNALNGKGIEFAKISVESGLILSFLAFFKIFC